jgi:hypothetical protein
MQFFCFVVVDKALFFVRERFLRPLQASEISFKWHVQRSDEEGIDGKI